jgi:hypothetical protein
MIDYNKTMLKVKLERSEHNPPIVGDDMIIGIYQKPKKPTTRDLVLQLVDDMKIVKDTLKDHTNRLDKIDLTLQEHQTRMDEH